MKVSKPIVLLGLIALPVAAEAEPKKKEFRDAATHQEISGKLERAMRADPMTMLDKSTGPDPSKENKPADLFEQSDIICFGGRATLVPKRAILSAPDGVRGRLALSPGAKFVPWSEFYRLNRGWISTVEVSRVQAEGRELIDEETRDRIGKSRNLVVATFKGGPISVLEPVAESETKEVRQ